MKRALPLLFVSLLWLTSGVLTAKEPVQAKKAAPSAKAAKSGKKPAAKSTKSAQKKKSKSAAAKVAPMSQEQKRAIFYKARDKAKGGHWKDVAALAYRLTVAAERGEEIHDLSEFMLAQALFELKVSHGSAEYLYNVVKNTGRVDLVPNALSLVEKIVRELPYDEDLIIRDLVYSNQFDFLPEELSDFINYYKGKMDIQNGFYAWAAYHFQGLKKFSYYYYKARYLTALEQLRRNRVKPALKVFGEIAAGAEARSDIKNQARQSMARLFYERKQYEKALKHYEAIDIPVLKQDSVFFEKGWSAYFLNQYQKALGYLHALEAPSYELYFAPERYLLKALIYKDLCIFDGGRRALTEFKDRYGGLVNQVMHRADLSDNDIAVSAAFQNSRLYLQKKFFDLLKLELAKIDKMHYDWPESGLTKHLQRIYRSKLREVERILDKNLDEQMKEVSLALLDYGERVNLLDYEIRLDELKRRRIFQGQQEIKLEKPSLIYKDRIFWPFDGEFWLDELNLYQVQAKSQCYALE